MLKRVLGALLALVALGLLSWQAFFHIDFDADPMNLLPQGLPQVGAMRVYDKAFASQNDVLIVLTQEDIERGDEAASSLTGFLAQREDLFRSLSSKPPWESEPSQMGEMLAYLWANGPPEELEKRVDDFLDGGVERELAASLDILENSMDFKEVTRVSHDPLHLSDFGDSAEAFRLEDATRFAFVSDDGELHLILAEPSYELERGSDVVAWLELANRAVDDWRAAHPDLAEETLVQFTGRKIYMTEITHALRRDLMMSVIITLGFVSVLFGILYRRLLPLVLLLAALYVTFVITLLLGELIYEELSAMSVGFAAILMGLAVDYGFVIYQEACCSGKDPRALRGLFGRCIGWAAATTACVFLALNRSVMPGAAQLGTMVAIGVCVGALMMIFPYASALARLCQPKKRQASGNVAVFASGRFAGWATVGLLLLVGGVLGMRGLPPLNPDPEALRPAKHQPAIELYRTVMQRLGSGDRRTLTVLADGETNEEMFEIFDRGLAILNATESVDSVMIPTRLCRNDANQSANRSTIRRLLEMEASWLAKAEAEGFVDDALTLTKQVFAAWRRFATAATGSFVMEEGASRWLLDRLTVDTPDQRLAIGFVRLEEGRFSLPLEIVHDLNEAGLRPIGWEFLSPEIRTVLQHDIRQVVIPTIIVLFLLLAVVFRSIKGVSISICLLGLSALVLLALMRLSGMDWNIVNIAAIPLLLGLGIDYSIHVILALRRSHGNVAEIHSNIGKALLLCGTTTAVGFGSLMYSRYGGLPQLGKLCAIGILITMLTAIYLVPHWWRCLHKKELHDRVISPK